MDKTRFKYSKTGKAMYISQLDLMATMQRSFLRAGINLKYSEGFNPHPYMSVALPLPVGCESICELMDVRIADRKLPDIKAIKLPEGLAILDTYVPTRKFNEITWIEISGIMNYDKQTDNDFVKKLALCFSKESIVISKRTKRGFKDIDIAPYIKDIKFGMEKHITISAKISAMNPTLNTDDIINAIDEKLRPEFISVKRIAIYDSNMIEFI